MSKTKIEWADRVWNPVTGCTKISPGCQNCYAERMSKRLAGRCGYPKDEPFKLTLHPARLEEPLHWRKPSRIFVCSMADLFHDDVSTKFIIDCLSIMAEAYQHTFMLLTKRPERMREILTHETIANDVWLQTSRGVNAEPSPWPLPNVWLGVTAENQEQADKRIPVLLQIPAAVRFVSVEPMLDEVVLSPWLGVVSGCRIHCPTTCRSCRLHSWECEEAHDNRPGINLVICGTESGPNRRATEIDAIRTLRDQCVEAGVPFFLKQMEIGGRLVKMPELDGQRWAQWPEATS